MNDSLLQNLLSCPHNQANGVNNEPFSKVITNDIWHCQYHVVFVPKYRFEILVGDVTREVEHCIRAFCDQQKGEVVELNVQIDHVHLLVMVAPKMSISSFVGIIKGRTAIRVFNKFRQLKNKPYWGNHFWSGGYCVDTVGLDSEMIRKHVKHQEDQEREREQFQLF